MKRKILSSVLVLLLVINVSAQKKKDNMQLKNANDSAAYSVGVLIGQQMKNDGFVDLDTKLVEAGLAAILRGDTVLLMKAEECNPTLMNFAKEKQKIKSEKASAEGKKFLQGNKNKPGVVTLPDGLQYIVMKEGNGPMPSINDTVVTHYHGTLIDGTVFDSSVDRGQPAEFPLKRVIAGWTEALQLMKAGSKWKLFVPSELAYGDRGQGQKIGPGQVLVFELELLEVKGK